jgi:hypothetical protein
VRGECQGGLGAVGRRGEHVAVAVDDDHADHVLALGQLHAAHAGGGAAHRADRGLGEAHALAVGGDEHDVALAVGELHVDQGVALVEPAGALTVLRHALALPLGLLPRMPGLTLLEGSAVTIRTPDMPVQTDGDTAGCAPVVVRETPFAIPVVVA